MEKNKKISVAERLLLVINANPAGAEDFRKELKDRFGYSVSLEDIRVNLLYLLRRGKISRKKDGSIYKYYI